MKIVLLEIEHYSTSAEGDNFQTPRPTWEDIESAIRKLDRDKWPMVWLHTDEPIYGEPPTDSLTVVGGRGEYQIYRFLDGAHINYDDPSRGSETVQIWESDQGSVVEKRALCNNLYRVLELVRFFALTGELSPDASWIEW